MPCLPSQVVEHDIKGVHSGSVICVRIIAGIDAVVTGAGDEKREELLDIAHVGTRKADEFCLPVVNAEQKALELRLRDCTHP
jgi:hypothetical protein